MRILINFDTDNAAFDGASDTDNALWALNAIRERVANGRTDGAIIDLNGNRVGSFGVYTDDDTGE